MKKTCFLIGMATLSLLYTGCVNSNFLHAKNVELHGKWESFYRDINCSNLTESYSLTDNIKSSFEVSVEFAKWYILGNKYSLTEMKRYLKRFVWMPINFEIRLGDMLHRERKDVVPNKGRYKRYYKQANRYLHNILKEIDIKSPYKFQIYIVRGNTKSLFSYPGGKIYVTRRAFSDKDFVRFALAHEMSHILKRHYVKEYQNLILDTIDNKDDLIKTIKSIRTDNVSDKDFQKLSSKIAQVYAARDTLVKITETLSNNQEIEADSCAVRLLAKENDLNNIIRAALSDLENEKVTYYKENGSLARIFDLNFHSHPSSSERIDNVKNIYKIVMNKQDTAQ